MNNETDRTFFFLRIGYDIGLFLLLPFLIAAGMIFFSGERYLFISSLIGIYTLLPFFWIFRKRGMSLQKMVVLAVLTAVGVAARYAFSMIPNVKPMAAIAIISGVAFEAESGFLVGSFTMFASNMIFGQGPWTPWQMFTMGLVGFFAGIFFRSSWIWTTKKRFRILALCLYGFFSVLFIYGGIMNPASLLMASYPITKENLTAIYISGLPIDLVHAGATVLFLFFGAEPLLKKIERVKRKLP